ncbi:MAG: hypothetical protein AB8G86_11765 [Saprospiraceae bacterium]
MQLNNFKNSLQQKSPPPNLSPNLLALWYDGKGDWTKAHDIADGNPYPEANWVHAYLHRKEGDDWNANYWYRRAGKTMPTLSLAEEWTNLVVYFLEKEGDQTTFQ